MMNWKETVVFAIGILVTGAFLAFATQKVCQCESRVREHATNRYAKCLDKAKDVRECRK